MPSTTAVDLSSLDVISPTIEAVTLNAISGILAQAFTAYKAQDLFAVDLAQILQFMLFTAIVAAPNYIFQTVLEKCFPTRTVPKSRLEQAQGKDRANDEDLLRKYGQLDVGNTVIKFFLGPVIERNDEHDAVHRRTGPDQGTELRVYSRSAFQGLLANVAGRLQVLASGMLAEPCHGADGV